MATESEIRSCLASDLLALGVRPGGVLLVHSSLKSLGHVPGGATTVIAALREALGPRGTLLLPALSFMFCDAQHPFFDVRRTPSCVGVIPEHFRTMPGVLRSVHPTHSVCGAGPLASELLSSHGLDTTPVGRHSPFRKLRDAGGQVLFLGCGLRPNTSMHGVEELVMPPYLLGDAIVYRVILADGSETEFPCRRHTFNVHNLRQRYDRLEPLMGPGEMRVGRVLEATAHLLEAPAMWARGEAALRSDPYFFVEKVV